MKKLSLLLLATVIIIFSSCSRIRPKKVNDIMMDGNWKITTYTEKGVSQINHYTSCNFRFINNDEVLACVGSNTVSGLWKVSILRGDVDITATRFCIVFTDGYSLENLNHLWYITNLSDNQVCFEEVEPEDGYADHLTFSKI